MYGDNNSPWYAKRNHRPRKKIGTNYNPDTKRCPEDRSHDDHDEIHHKTNRFDDERELNVRTYRHHQSDPMLPYYQGKFNTEEWSHQKDQRQDSIGTAEEQGRPWYENRNQRPFRPMRERIFCPLRYLKLSKSRCVLLFPIPSDDAWIETAIESTTRNKAIDLSLSPPVGFRFLEIGHETWDCIAGIVKSRYMPYFHEAIKFKLPVQAAVGLQSMKICIAIFSSIDAAVGFAGASHTLPVQKNEGESPSVELQVHALESAPIDLFPLPRVTSHPAFLDFKFKASRLETWHQSELMTMGFSRQSTLPWGTVAPQLIYIHQRRGTDLKARPIVTVPLAWQCIGCDTQNICSDSCRYCSSCGSARTVLSPLFIGATSPPPDAILEVLRRPGPALRDFILTPNSCGLHYDPTEDIYMLPDEATDRDSYSWFTSDGLFYTLDIPTNELILTHALSVDQSEDHIEGGPITSGIRVVFQTVSTTDIKSTAGEEQRLANASLVASVLAQAQRAVVQAVKAPKSIETPVNKHAERASPVRMSITPKLLNTVKDVEKLVEWQLPVEPVEEETTGSTPFIDPARKPSIRELRMYQNASSNSNWDKNSNQEDTNICFFCLRQFHTTEELADHETCSATHQANVKNSARQEAGLRAVAEAAGC